MTTVRLLVKLLIPLILALIVFVILETRVRPPQLGLVGAVITGIGVYYLIRDAVDRLLILPWLDYWLQQRRCRKLLIEIDEICRDPLWLATRPPIAQEALRKINRLLNRIFLAIQADDNKHDLIGTFLAKHLLTIHELLDNYHRLTERGIDFASGEIFRTELTLPRIIEQLRKTIEQIHEQDTFEMGSTRELLEASYDPDGDDKLSRQFIELEEGADQYMPKEVH